MRTKKETNKLGKRILMKEKFKTIILNKIPENIASIKQKHTALKKEKPENQ